MGVDALACNATQTIAPGLRLGADATTRPATRRQIDELIARMLDEEDGWRGMRGSLLAERVIAGDYIEEKSGATWAIRPLAMQTLTRNARSMEGAIQASGLRNWPAAKAALARHTWEKPIVEYDFGVALGLWAGPEPAVPRYSRWFQVPGGDSFGGYIERHHRVLAERRVTAVSLATQFYRADNGRWPGRLDELAPRYLPAVPADPFHDDGRPLGYVVLKGRLPGGADRPLVYFDAGPDDVEVLAEPMYGWDSGYRGTAPQPRSPVRQYRDLSRFEPPSPKTVDNDP
jgi:hypothetical protein